MFTLILLVFAFVFACIAAWPYPAPSPEPRCYCLIATYLACFYLANILSNALIAQHLGGAVGR